MLHQKLSSIRPTLFRITNQSKVREKGIERGGGGQLLVQNLVKKMSAFGEMANEFLLQKWSTVCQNGVQFLHFNLTHQLGLIHSWMLSLPRSVFVCLYLRKTLLLAVSAGYDTCFKCPLYWAPYFLFVF